MSVYRLRAERIGERGGDRVGKIAKAPCRLAGIACLNQATPADSIIPYASFSIIPYASFGGKPSACMIPVQNPGTEVHCTASVDCANRTVPPVTQLR